VGLFARLLSGEKVSGRFSVEKRRKRLLRPGDAETSHVKVITFFCGAFFSKKATIFFALDKTPAYGKVVYKAY
jgi:hypothetical protein